MAAVLTYDAPREINEAYDCWERGILRNNLPSAIKGKNALDLGCGIGRIAVELAKAGAHVAAVDISRSMLAACRKRALAAGVADRVELIESPVRRLPDNLGKFDLITCFGLLEHLPPSERRHCLSSAFACLKKRGRMLVVVNNTESLFVKRRKSGKAKRLPGYYFSLVGLRRLERLTRSLGMDMTLLAANPFYAWLHYGICGGQAAAKLSRGELRRLARLVCELDVRFPLHGPLPFHLASHFMVELRRR